MLQKIDTVEEIGRFESLKHKAPHLAKLSLVYARNGYGKSTLCAILRSASKNEANILKARRRLQAKKPSKVQLLWSSGSTVVFNGSGWNCDIGRTYVFDQDFVSTNIFIGESVTRDNKRSLLPIVIGEDGVKVATSISALDREIRNLDADEKTHSALLDAKFGLLKSIGTSVEAYCTVQPPDSLEASIREAEKSFELSRQAKAVIERQPIPSISFPSLEAIREALARSIEDVSESALQKIADHERKHGLGSQGRRWLKYGIDNNEQASTCPFCDQGIEDNSLVQAYSACFGIAFSELSAHCDTINSSVRKMAEGQGFRKAISALNTEIEFWKDKCLIADFPEFSEDRINLCEEGLAQLTSLLSDKASNPIKKITLGTLTTEIASVFDAVRDLESYTNSCAGPIAAARTEASSADIHKAEKTLKYLKALERKSDPEIKKWIDAFLNARTKKKEAERKKKDLQTKLRKDAELVVSVHQDNINRLLSLFGANFRVVETKANFKGREPNAEFAIEISDHRLSVGERRDDAPCFATVLSSGDKSTLALAFFLTQVNSDNHLDQAVVVLDDPFHSQDQNRQFETASQIRKVAEKSAQTIVFSHDPRFLHLIEKDAPDSETATFQLRCNAAGQGDITQWQSADSLKALYIRQSEIIREFAMHGQILKGQDLNSVKQAIRPFLEDYINARFPGRFTELTMLGSMIEAINDAGTSDPLFNSVEELRSLNEYTRPNMHGGAEPPDEDELKSQCNKVITIVGSY